MFIIHFTKKLNCIVWLNFKKCFKKFQKFYVLLGNHCTADTLVCLFTSSINLLTFKMWCHLAFSILLKTFMRGYSGAKCASMGAHVPSVALLIALLSSFSVSLPPRALVELAFPLSVGISKLSTKANANCGVKNFV